MHKNLLKSILYGVAVGDALGVPVEFESRDYLIQNPITDMIGFGTHNQPKGTWSDDTSLTLCLAESIVEGFDLQKLANKFIGWRENNLWTANGCVFDIGNGTSLAIDRLANGEKPELAGGFEVSDNGNGSLMRILPLLLLIKDFPVEERFSLTKEISSLTHAHIRSIISCFYYLEFAKQIIEGKDKFQIYQNLKIDITAFLNKLEINKSEISLFNRLLIDDIFQLDEDEIKSSGYVLHSLEACIWCLLITNNYSEATLKAINLGDDTDTTGAITGGLAALVYGFENIPKNWICVIAKNREINQLIHKYKSSEVVFETEMKVKYLYSGKTDDEENFKLIDKYNQTFKTKISLTNSSGINTLSFNFNNPFSNSIQNVEIDLNAIPMILDENGNSFLLDFISIESNKNEYNITGCMILDVVKNEYFHIFETKFSVTEKQKAIINRSSIYIGKAMDL